MMTTCAPTRVFAPRVAVTLSQRKSVVVYSNGAINPDIKKDEPKVVDEVVASDMAKPMTAYCRCWRSKTFPLCNVC
jgi:CDGSH iron-sulfur domain-containing protein 2